MKKQILFLVLVFFSISISSVFGQKAVHDSPSDVTAGCVDDPLHPIAGKLYNYAAAIGGTETGTYTWWATKDPSFITSQGVNNLGTALTVGAGSPITAVSASYGISGGATGSVDITWGSTVLANTTFQGASPTFVVVQVNGTGTTCADNLKVYELDPRNGFIVDIRNIDEADLTVKLPYSLVSNENQCIDLVSKATYVAGAMQYEYGTNSFYYEIVAANFSEKWKPFLTFSGLNGVQTSAIEWTYDKTFATGLTAYVSGTTEFETDELATQNGVSVYVKVTVTNNNYEGLSDKDLTLTLDGQNKDNAWDIKNSTCVDPLAADGDDIAIQTMKLRPTITPGTSSVTVPNISIVPGNSIP